MDDILHWLSQFGYIGLFAALVFGIAGLPIPDETLLVFFGYLVSRGKMHPALTWLTALAGSMGGISLSYTIGRVVGYRFVHRYGRYVHLTEERLRQIQQWFDRIGHWLLTIGYFLPGIRHFTALVAGMSEMKFRSFALFAYPGAVLWITSFLALGYFLGDQWEVVFNHLHQQMTLITVILSVVAVAVWYWKKRRKQKSDRRSL
jgi:membrane protein DedA with SNARE-associated domain